jgi:hypothetical protein
MTTEQDHIKTLTEIRTIMEKSSRFISLSGLSGVFAGIFALLGAAGAFLYLNIGLFSTGYYERGYEGSSLNIDFLTFFFVDGITVLVLALTFGILFTVRNSKKKGVPIWGTMAKLTIINLFLPLCIGGIFCLILLYHHLIFLIAPSTLLFYGLALFNAGKYTLIEVRYLGLTEMLLGLVACLFAGYGLLFWALGFGVLHIIYGTVMYFKYERS